MENILDNLPLCFDACPKCGSTDRAMEKITEELIAKGVLPKKFGDGAPEWAKGMMQTIPLVDPNHLPAIIAPIMTCKAVEMYMDICVGCGIMYATRINLIDAPLQIQQQPATTKPGTNGPQKRHF